MANADRTLKARIAVLAALAEAGHKIPKTDRALLEWPVAKKITPWSEAQARVIVREAAELVSEILAGTLSLKAAHAIASERAQNRRRQPVPPPPPKRPSAPAVPLAAPPALGPYDVITHNGKSKPLSVWAREAGFTTCGPLQALLRAGVPLSQALAKASR